MYHPLPKKTNCLTYYYIHKHDLQYYLELDRKTKEHIAYLTGKNQVFRIVVGQVCRRRVSSYLLVGWLATRKINVTSKILYFQKTIVSKTYST